PSKAVEKIILNREDALIQNEISRAYLHFHPAGASLTTEFAALNLDAALATSAGFSAHVMNHLQSYKANVAYDPLAVCCAVRLEIERKTYAQLQVPDQQQFLATWKTVEKLRYAEAKGVQVPEIH